MSLFAIYKYEFVPTSTRGLSYQGTDGESLFSLAQNQLSQSLTTENFKLYLTKKTGEPVVYPYKVLCTRQEVTVMRVCNVKHITLVKEYKERMEESNPWCYVIIDARPGVAQIAIERTGAFDSNTDRVRDIFRESWGGLLSELGYALEIRAKMRVAGFWETVDYRVSQCGDTVSQVVFDFSDPREAGPLDASPEALERLKLIASLTRSMGAAKASLRMDSTKEGTLRLDQAQKDLAQMVSLCCRNGYGISVRFREIGVYRYGGRTQTFYKIAEQLINDFVSGQYLTTEEEGKQTFALINDLDTIREQTKDYEDEKKIDKRGKRTHRRAF